MRQGSILLTCLAVSTILCAAPVFADTATEDLQSKVIERFDAADSSGDASKYEYAQNHRWIVRGSKFLDKDTFKQQLVNTYPQALFPNAAASADLKALGVYAAFDRRGYNFLEFVPVADKDVDGKPVEQGIDIPGRVKNIDLWAWGSNYNYYLDLHLQDWTGAVHVLRVGDLTFRGWKNFRVEVPPSISQDVQYYPATKSLKLVKLVLWTRPEEKVNGFYFYLDHIKAITDVFETPFDGSALGDPATIQKIWAANGSQTK